MVDDFPAWFDDLVEYCDLESSHPLKEVILREADEARHTKEDIYRHRRQVTPGDHKRKLQPETIAILNSTFSDILKGFGYI
jgi:hypothetical protein